MFLIAFSLRNLSKLSDVFLSVSLSLSLSHLLCVSMILSEERKLINKKKEIITNFKKENLVLILYLLHVGKRKQTKNKKEKENCVRCLGRRLDGSRQEIRRNHDYQQRIDASYRGTGFNLMFVHKQQLSFLPKVFTFLCLRISSVRTLASNWCRLRPFK